MPELPLLGASLSDGGVVVRPFAERDIPEILIAYQEDPELHRRLGQRRPPSGAELGRAAEQAESDRRHGRRLWLTITLEGQDRCVGQVNLHSIRWEGGREAGGGRGELALWVAPGVRRRGHAHRALSLAACWLLEHAPLSRLELLVDPGNEPMKRTAAAVGARLEPRTELLRYVLERPARER